MTTLTRIKVPCVTGADCVSKITEQLRAVPNAGRMTVQVNKNADSIISVLSAAPLPEEVLRDAIAQAGFETSSIKVIEDALAHQMAEQALSRQASRNLPSRTERGAD